MRKLLTAALAATLVLATCLSASATPWVRKAAVDGEYGGHYHRTQCTYSECSPANDAYRIRWLFTPVDGGIRMFAPAQDYRMFLRWVPGDGVYVGKNLAEPGRARRITIHVTRQSEIGGVWTARTLTGTLRTWLTDFPRFHDQGTVTLTRRGPVPPT